MFLPKQKINLICNTGALGDTVSSLPTVKILYERGLLGKCFIDDRFYDIKGTVLDNKNYIPYKNYGKEMFKNSFRHLYKEQFKF